MRLVRTCPHCGATLKPMREANLDDLLTLVALVRDALVAGHPTLAVTILGLLAEHKTGLGLRSRKYADMIREQMDADERDPAEQ